MNPFTAYNQSLPVHTIYSYYYYYSYNSINIYYYVTVFCYTLPNINLFATIRAS